MNKICILGSMNMDMVLRVKNQPKEGETILAKSFEKIPGGKGANQAVAAKRSGSEVYMIAKVGKDDNGKYLKEKLEHEKIDTSFVFEDKREATGMAVITINDKGDNSIIVVPGSNMTLTQYEIEATYSKLAESDILIAQFETNEDMTINAFKKAKELGKVTILNPAPAKKIDDELLKVTDIIIPNETEAELLTGIKVETLEDAQRAGKIFLEKGVKYSIITLGSKGAAVIGEDFNEIVDAYKVNAIDTTAAGDSFIGGLSSKLDCNNLTKDSLIESVRFGNRVSSITVQRSGAQPSIPYLREVIEIYGEE
ncbi:MAG TPA: ribokinase [Clostridium sp.]|nr:ribokinase [Clostridium sp.]